MQGIPPELLVSLPQILESYDEFTSDDRLKSVFNDKRLTPWRSRLPHADNDEDRISFTITYLNKPLETGDNLLVLFLHILADKAEANRRPYKQLRKLAEDLAQEFQDTSAPHRTSHIEESNPGGQKIYPSADVNLLSKSTSAVARVKVPQVIDGKEQKRFPNATAWLIDPNIDMTCWHVMKARGPLDRPLTDTDRKIQIENSVLAFDYTQSGQGKEYRVTTLEGYNIVLDYALLRLETRTDFPLSAYGFLKLDRDVPLTQQTELYVIQHPKGEPQKYASGHFRRYQDSQGTRILYDTPTEHGTSGAPVLNTLNWRVLT